MDTQRHAGFGPAPPLPAGSWRKSYNRWPDSDRILGLALETEPHHAQRRRARRELRDEDEWKVM
jgi:hypothetical protein